MQTEAFFDIDLFYLRSYLRSEIVAFIYCFYLRTISNNWTLIEKCKRYLHLPLLNGNHNKCRLLSCFRSLSTKQCRPRSDCSYRGMVVTHVVRICDPIPVAILYLAINMFKLQFVFISRGPIVTRFVYLWNNVVRTHSPLCKTSFED